MVTKRKATDDNAAKTMGLSLTLSRDVVDRLDDFRLENSGIFLSRSDEIQKICQYFLDGIVCPHCGTRNPPKEFGAHYCSKCQKNLLMDDNQRDLALNIFREQNGFIDTDDFKYYIYLKDEQLEAILNGEKIKFNERQVKRRTKEEIKKEMEELREKWRKIQEDKRKSRNTVTK